MMWIVIIILKGYFSIQSTVSDTFSYINITFYLGHHFGLTSVHIRYSQIHLNYFVYPKLCCTICHYLFFTKYIKERGLGIP